MSFRTTKFKMSMDCSLLWVAVFLLWHGCAGASQEIGRDIAQPEDIQTRSMNDAPDSSPDVSDSSDTVKAICADDMSCDDGDPCTDDSCAPSMGCLYKQNSSPCEDGDFCTVGDRCSAGECVSGEVDPCAAGDSCTDYFCPDSCNGAPENCHRPYNQVSQVCTHNAFATVNSGFIVPAPNQKYSLTRQLDDGVRCLMLDIHSWLGKLRLCHGACEAGQRDLDDALEEIGAWLEENPTEVVSLILEAHVGEADIFEALVHSGLAHSDAVPTPETHLYFHDQPPGSPWPTLLKMVTSRQRLVVFSDLDLANGSWNLDWRKYGWETPYDDDSFTCAPSRGDPLAYDNQVFILNHYTLCALGACNQAAEENNAFEFLFERSSECWKVHTEYNPWGQIPTFLNVDNYHLPTSGGFTERPDVFDVADALNALWGESP